MTNVVCMKQAYKASYTRQPRYTWKRSLHTTPRLITQQPTWSNSSRLKSRAANQELKEHIQYEETAVATPKNTTVDRIAASENRKRELLQVANRLATKAENDVQPSR